MAALCDLKFIGTPKFDEVGRQQSLKRLTLNRSMRRQAFERVVDLTIAAIKVPICAISIVDGDRQWFLAQRGLKVDETARSIAFCDHTIRGTEPMVVQDALADPRFANNPLVLGGPLIRSYVGIPLRLSDGYAIGTLCVADTHRNEYSARKISLLQDFARTIVKELELFNSTVLDSQTGFLSSSAWVDRFSYNFDRARNSQSGLCIVIIDIDNFRQINSQHGDAVGELVIEQISLTLKTLLPQGAHIGRLGGEEWAVCLCGASIAAARSVAEQIRQAIASLTFATQPDLRCTASIGIANFRPSEPRDVVLRRSDLALQTAKSRGRNSVWLA